MSTTIALSNEKIIVPETILADWGEAKKQLQKRTVYYG